MTDIQPSEYKSENIADSLIKNAPIGIFEIECSGNKFLNVNDATCRITGYDSEELLSMSPLDLTDDIGRDIFHQKIKKILEGKIAHESVEIHIRRKDNIDKILSINLGSLIYKDGKPSSIFLIAIDITEHKRADYVMQHLASFPRNNPNPVLEIDTSLNIIYMNTALHLILIGGGYEKKDVKLFLPADMDSILESIDRKNNTLFYREVNFMNRIYHQSISFVEDFNVIRIYAADITERKLMEDELKQNIRTMNALSNSNRILTRTTAEKSYLQNVCKVIINDCGHTMVWIGYAENDEAKTVRPIVHAGFDDGYIDTLSITWADMERGRGPTGTAIRTGRISVCNDMLTDPNFRPWREQAIKHGYASSIVFPMFGDDNIVFGALTIYSRMKNAFSESEIDLLSKLVNDVSYGIKTLRLKESKDKMEESLSETRNYLENLFDYANAPIIVWNPDFIITRFNHAFEKLTGYTSDEVVGKRLEILFPDEYKEESLKKIQSTSEGEYLESIEIRILRKDNNVKIALWNSANINDKSGKLISTIAQGQDITERKKAEIALLKSKEEWERTFDSVPDLISIIDTKHRIIAANKAMAKSLEMTSEQCVGLNCYKCVHKSLNPLEGCPHSLTLIDKKQHIAEIHEDNLHGDFLVSTTPLFDDNGELLGSVHVARDITERKKSELALQNLVKDKETLIREVHHRVKNNLQVIYSLIRMQSRRTDNRYIKNALEDGQSRIKSMALINEILYKSDNISNLDIRRYLDELTKYLREAYNDPTKKIVIDMDIDNISIGLDDAISCGLVVNELVSNSLKYAFQNRDSGRLSISFKNRDSNAELVVADDGSGLPEGFDLQKSQSLGLQLVNSLTRQLEGTLETKVENGTQFRISFPIKNKLNE